MKAVWLSIRSILRLISVGKNAQQKIRKAIHITGLDARSRGKSASEIVVAIFVPGEKGDLVLVTPAQKLESEFEVMRAFHPRETIAHFKSEVRIDARMSQLIGRSAQEV